MTETTRQQLAEAERTRRCGPLSDCARRGHADRTPGESLKDHAWLPELGDDDEDGDDDSYCIPGCPDDICRMSGHCAYTPVLCTCSWHEHRSCALHPLAMTDETIERVVNEVLGGEARKLGDETA